MVMNCNKINRRQIFIYLLLTIKGREVFTWSCVPRQVRWADGRRLRCPTASQESDGSWTPSSPSAIAALLLPAVTSQLANILLAQNPTKLWQTYIMLVDWELRDYNVCNLFNEQLVLKKQTFKDPNKMVKHIIFAAAQSLAPSALLPWRAKFTGVCATHYVSVAPQTVESLSLLSMIT